MTASAESALIIAVPEVEPLVGRFREEYDSSGSVGVPAHVTLLYPFLAPHAIGTGDLAALAGIFASTASFDVTFRECRRFGGTVLWLTPEPSAPILSLMRRIFERWPECPPYDGSIPTRDVVPHLTVSDTVEDEEHLDRIERALQAGLPVTTCVAEALLIDSVTGSWTTRRRFSLES